MLSRLSGCKDKGIRKLQFAAVFVFLFKIFISRKEGLLHTITIVKSKAVIYSAELEQGKLSWLILITTKMFNVVEVLNTIFVALSWFDTQLIVGYAFIYSAKLYCKKSGSILWQSTGAFVFWRKNLLIINAGKST